MKKKEKLVKPIKKLQNAITEVNNLTREKDELIDKVKLALLKHQDRRQGEDMLAIETLMMRFKFFNDFRQKQGNRVYSEFCNHLYYRKTLSGEKVISKGHLGQTFFVLLNGTVAVVIYNPITAEARKQILYQQQMLNQGQNFIPDYDNPDLFESMEIAQLESGATFGDLALLQSTSITSATILTKRPCEFACMDKKSFWKFSGKQKQLEIEEKLSNLRQLPFLSGWYELDLKTISFEFKPFNYFKGQTIIQQGKARIGLYLITQGEVLIEKRKTIHYTDCEDMLRKGQSEQVMRVAVLSAPQYFGDGFGSNYEYTAICQSQQVQLFFISKQDLEKRLNWNPKSKLIYTQLSQKHSEFYNQRQDHVENHLHMKNPFENEGTPMQIKDIWNCLSIPEYHAATTNNKPAKFFEKVSKVPPKQTKIDFLSVVKVLDQSTLQDDDFQIPPINKGRTIEQKKINVLTSQLKKRNNKIVRTAPEIPSIRMKRSRSVKFPDKNAVGNSIFDDQNSLNKVDSPSKNKSITSFMGLNVNKKFRTLNSINSISRKESMIEDQSQGFCVQSSKLFRIIIRKKNNPNEPQGSARPITNYFTPIGDSRRQSAPQVKLAQLQLAKVKKITEASITQFSPLSKSGPSMIQHVFKYKRLNVP